VIKLRIKVSDKESEVEGRKAGYRIKKWEIRVAGRGKKLESKRRGKT
jgi:hypothetical protein